MRRWLFAIVALLLLMAVLYITISPAVDLDPTITRAWQLACLLICALAYWGRVQVHLLRGTPLQACKSPARVPLGPPASSPTGSQLDCSRLC